MNSSYRKFYRAFYLRTEGGIPTKPLNENVYPGDFFQIRNGQMVILGNIFRNGLVESHDVSIEKLAVQNPSNWSFSEGVSKAYSGRETKVGIEGEFEFSKQILAFDSPGSYIFKGNDVESVRISNWADISDALIIKLTQTHYSFRELYVVTGSFTTSNWTLAIAGSANAELELATDSENFGLSDIFGESRTKTIQAKDIEYYHREDKRRPVFFNAKKLSVQEEKYNTLVNELISSRSDVYEWANSFYEGYPFDHGSTSNPGATRHDRQNVLDMLQANELNPNTALQYFKWTNADMDDIEKLFMNFDE